MAQGGDPSLAEVYEDAARSNGHQPGFCMIPPLDTATTVFVAEDVDRAWDELGRHILHDVTSYASINVGRHSFTASISEAKTIDELRSEDRTHRIITVEEAVETVRSGMPLALHPLIGGLAPEVAWRYFRTVTETVMPAVTGAT
jgi:hypothetical protein